MEPHEFAATPVAQVKVQVIAVLLEPDTRPLKSCVLLVITLARVGEIAMVTPEDLLLPHPIAPSAAARVSIVENFHHLIPVLPRFLSIRPRSTNITAWRSSGLPHFESHILRSGLQNPQSKRPAHREAERAYWIEEIRPLRVIK